VDFVKINVKVGDLQKDIYIFFTQLQQLSIIVLSNIHHTFVDLIIKDGSASHPLVFFNDPDAIHVNPTRSFALKQDMKPPKGKKPAFCTL
jgi:hypothetical protein